MLKAVLPLLFVTISTAPLSAKRETVFLSEQANNNLIARPTSVLEIDDLDNFSNYAGNADNIVFTVNDTGKIIDKNNYILSEDISNIFKMSRFLDKGYFCFRLNTSDALNAFATSLGPYTDYLEDCTIISNSIDIIESARSKHELDFEKFRFAYDATKMTSINLNSIRRVTNEANANIVIISEEMIKKEEIRQAQKLGKTIWVKTTNDTPSDLYKCMVSGALGIVTSDINECNYCFNKIAVAGSVIFRSQFVVALRGDSHRYGENTIDAYQSALNCGAEGIQVGLRFTKDKKIIAMNHEYINDTTSCQEKKKISEMNLSEIKQYKVIRGLDKENVEPKDIPTIEDIFEFMKGNNLILFAEVDSFNANTIADFANRMKNIIELYDMKDRIVFVDSLMLSSLDVAIKRCREIMPYIWGINDKIYNSGVLEETRLGISPSIHVSSLVLINKTSFSLIKKGYAPSFCFIPGMTLDIDIEDASIFINYIRGGAFMITTGYIQFYSSVIKEINSNSLEYDGDLDDTKNIKLVGKGSDYINSEHNLSSVKFIESFNNDTEAVVAGYIGNPQVNLLSYVNLKKHFSFPVVAVVVPIVVVVVVSSVVAIIVIKKKKRDVKV